MISSLWISHTMFHLKNKVKHSSHRLISTPIPLYGKQARYSIVCILVLSRKRCYQNIFLQKTISDHLKDKLYLTYHIPIPNLLQTRFSTKNAFSVKYIKSKPSNCSCSSYHQQGTMYTFVGQMFLKNLSWTSTGVNFLKCVS